MLALCLVFGQVPATVFAADPGTAPDETAETHNEPEVTVSPVEEEAVPPVEASGTCGDNLTWILSDEGLLTISGTGPMKDYSNMSSNLAPWSSNAASVKSLIIENGVTTIGAHAFRNIDTLSSVQIPDSVTSIGHSTFSGCESLTVVEIPDGVTAIGYEAFRNCVNLTRVEIGYGVTTIDYWAFCCCDSLNEILFRGGCSHH